MKAEIIYVENIKCRGCMSSIKDMLQKLRVLSKYKLVRKMIKLK